MLAVSYVVWVRDLEEMLLNDTLIALPQSDLEVDECGFGCGANLRPAFWHWVMLCNGVGRTRRDRRGIATVYSANGVDGREEVGQVHSERRRFESTTAMIPEDSCYTIYLPTWGLLNEATSSIW